MDNFKETKEAIDKLKLLLDAPEPGLSTWHDFVNIQMEKLHKAYFGRLCCQEDFPEIELP